MVPIIAAVVVGLTGAAFLLAGAYQELSLVYTPSIAAAVIGAGLVLIAAVLWLVGSRKPKGVLEPMARAAVGVQPPEQAVDQIVTALRQESPLSVVAAAAGLLFGLFLRGRHN